MLKMLAAIVSKLGVDLEGDPSLQVLQQATAPDVLADQIDKASSADGS